MIEKIDTTRVAEDLREILKTALADGVGQGELVSTFATIMTEADREDPELAELAEERWDHPIYDEIPPGLIDIRTAAERYNCTIKQLQAWIRRGHISSYGRIRGPARGGGYHLVKEKQVVERMAMPPNRGGRPRKNI